MTTLHLLRHGTNDFLESGRLAGRLPGVSLNAPGRAQADALASDPVYKNVVAILSSPLERARETVEPLAGRLGLEIEIMDDLLEIDFGEWSGRHYQELVDRPEWKRFNQYRSGSHALGGESMIDVQYRMIRAVEAIRERYPDGEVVVSSHGDPIRSLLCWCLGIPLDLILRVEVEPASRSTVAFGDWGPNIKALNAVAAHAT